VTAPAGTSRRAARACCWPWPAAAIVALFVAGGDDNDKKDTAAPASTTTTIDQTTTSYTYLTTTSTTAGATTSSEVTTTTAPASATTTPTTRPRRTTTTTKVPMHPGDDAKLDALYNQCGAGNMQACDDLYTTSPPGSEYESYGDTCGNRNDPGAYCTELYPATGASYRTAKAQTYGDSAQLDALWDDCGTTGGAACDELSSEAAQGTGYEHYGLTCGNRGDAIGGCAGRRT
jgi:hypothetical protein